MAWVRWRLELSVMLVLLFVASVDCAAQNNGPARGTTSFNPDAITGPNYLSQSMLANVTPAAPPFEIFKLASLPEHDGVPSTRFNYYPLTVAYSWDIARSKVSSFSTAKYAWLQWTNRCTAVPSCVQRQPRPNQPPGDGFSARDGSLAGMNFSTYDKADAASIAAALYVNGFPAHASGPCPTGLRWCGYLDATTAAGIPDSRVIPWSTAKASVDTYFPTRIPIGSTAVGTRTYAVSTDLVVLPNFTFAGGSSVPWGTICDCEMADSRLASRTLALMTQIANIHHAKGLKYAVTADPVLGAGKLAGYCGAGISSPNCDMVNLGAIANVVDLFFLVVHWLPPRGYTFQTQLSMYLSLFGKPGTYPANHIGIAFGLGGWSAGTTIEDAKYAHSFIVSHGLGAVQYGPTQGQQCRWTTLKAQLLLGLPTGACKLNVGDRER